MADQDGRPLLRLAAPQIYPRKKRQLKMGGAYGRRRSACVSAGSLDGDAYTLAVIARATRPAHAEEAQHYAVVVSIEFDDTRVDVYQAVRARLSAARVGVRVPSR